MSHTKEAEEMADIFCMMHYCMHFKQLVVSGEQDDCTIF